MNCRPGDLARVLWGSSLEESLIHQQVARAIQDRIVRVVDLREDGFWTLEQPMLVSVTLPVVGLPARAEILALHDSILRPIRDPGDEAVDEMVRDVGRPNELPADVIAEVAA